MTKTHTTYLLFSTSWTVHSTTPSISLCKHIFHYSTWLLLIPWLLRSSAPSSISFRFDLRLSLVSYIWIPTVVQSLITSIYLCCVLLTSISSERDPLPLNGNKMKDTGRENTLLIEIQRKKEPQAFKHVSTQSDTGPLFAVSSTTRSWRRRQWKERPSSLLTL